MRKAFLLLAVIGLTCSLWAADPHFGTWKMNAAKSKVVFGNQPPLKSDIVKFEELENGIKLTSDFITPDGEAHHNECIVRYDGKDYPCPERTISFIKVDDYTFDQVMKEDGKVVATAREVISKDGKTITRTYTAKDENGQNLFIDIAVYEKQ